MLEYSMSVKLLSENHFEFLSLKGGCTGLFESIRKRYFFINTENKVF